MTFPTARLDTLCRAVNVGHVGPSSMHRDPNGVPFLMGKNVGFGALLIHSMERVSEDFHRSQPKSQIRSGDVLVVRIGKSGQAAKVPANLGEANCSGLVIIKQPHGINADFLVYYLNSPEGRRGSMAEARGSTRLTLNTGSVAAAQVPVPALHDQERIVAVLDEALAGIASARVNAERNAVNARAFFESHFEASIARGGAGWVETTLGAEAELLAGFAFKSSGFTQSASSVRLLGGDNIVPGAMRWDEARRWPASEANEYKRYELRSGDVVLAMDRPWVAAGLKRARVRDEDLPCLLVQRTARLRGDRRLDNDFLFYLLGSSSFARHVLGVQTGLGVPHISGQQIKDFRFLRPPLGEQQDMALLFDALAKRTQRLEAIYAIKQEALEELKMSLLQRAFRGELRAPAA